MGWLEKCSVCGSTFEERGSRGPQRKYCDPCIDMRRAINLLDRSLQRVGHKMGVEERKRTRRILMSIGNRWLPFDQERDTKTGRFK